MAMTIDDRIPLTRDPVFQLPLRLCLKSSGSPPALLDGAWWPRTGDLLRELPLLTEVLDPLWGHITRAAVNPMHWPAIPRKVPVYGHVVKISRLVAARDVHEVVLLSEYAGRWVLLVIPPETDVATAQRLMSAAVGPDRCATATAFDEAEHTRAEAISGGMRCLTRLVEGDGEAEDRASTRSAMVPPTRRCAMGKK
jgi:uncharacterized protein DUF5994